jgi:hypothetical protein
LWVRESDWGCLGDKRTESRWTQIPKNNYRVNQTSKNTEELDKLNKENNHGDINNKTKGQEERTRTQKEGVLSVDADSR